MYTDHKVGISDGVRDEVIGDRDSLRDHIVSLVMFGNFYIDPYRTKQTVENVFDLPVYPCHGVTIGSSKIGL